MLKKPFVRNWDTKSMSEVRKASAPVVSLADRFGEMVQACTIRFLDDSEPMSVHFKVGYLLFYRQIVNVNSLYKAEVGVAPWIVMYHVRLLNSNDGLISRPQGETILN